MAVMAMSFFYSTFALSQTKSSGLESKKKTSVLLKKSEENSETENEQKTEETILRKNNYESATPRKLRQHGVGFGLGQTFLLGKYSDHGDDKITFDLLYSYAASYSFDLLIDGHMSEHEHKDQKFRTLALATSIKARLVEYDNFSPFVLGGLGFYAPRIYRDVDGENEWSQRKITFGLNFGGGADLRLNDNYVVGLLGQMHWPFVIRQDQGSDVKGYYFKLLITGMYLF